MADSGEGYSWEQTEEETPDIFIGYELQSMVEIATPIGVKMVKKFDLGTQVMKVSVIFN